MLTKEGINRTVSRIALMPFFPASDPSARAVLAEEIGSMCESDAHASWLAIRMGQVFKKQWPGVGEMRALYCKRFKPIDGYEVGSEVYPDGFPSEADLGPLQIKGLPEPPKALPAVSKRAQITSPESRQMLSDLLKSTEFPK